MEKTDPDATLKMYGIYIQPIMCHAQYSLIKIARGLLPLHTNCIEIMCAYLNLIVYSDTDMTHCVGCESPVHRNYLLLRADRRRRHRSHQLQVQQHGSRLSDPDPHSDFKR